MDPNKNDNQEPTPNAQGEPIQVTSFGSTTTPNEASEAPAPTPVTEPTQSPQPQESVTNTEESTPPTTFAPVSMPVMPPSPQEPEPQTSNLESVTPPTTQEPTPTPNSIDGVTPPSPTIAPSEPTVSGITPPAPDTDSPITPVPAAYSANSAPKGNKKLVKLGIIAGLVVLLLGGGALAFTQVFIPYKQNELFKKAIVLNVEPGQITSKQFEGSIEITGDTVPEFFKNLTFKGSAEGADKLAMTLSGGPQSSVNFDMLAPDAKSMYLKLGFDPRILAQAPQLSSQLGPGASAYLPMLPQVANKWFSFDASGLGLISPGGPKTFLVPEADLKKLSTAMQENLFFKASKRHADEKIHGVDSYHITAVIDKVALGKFIDDIANSKPEYLGNSAEDLKKMKEDIAKTDFEKHPFDIWVAKGDPYLTQIKFEIKSEGTTFKIRYAQKDFNKSVDIQKPAQSAPLLPLLSRLMGNPNAR